MDRFEPLGKRDIFGILLPGSILVFVGAYSLLGVLAILQLPVKDLLDNQLLVTVVLLITAYLAGSVLRLSAADDVDRESSKLLLREWERHHDLSHIESVYEERRAELAAGNGDVKVDSEFDGWLYRTEIFPYPAWQNRKWQAQGLHDVLEFFRNNHLKAMWPTTNASPKTFFNYCKLTIVSSGDGLAEEVNAAEGLTRFFAGTVIALGLSIWLLAASLVSQLIIVAILAFGPHWGLASSISINWALSGFCLVFTFILIPTVRWIRQKMVTRFHYVRVKEAETVYHAFYLYSIRQSDKTDTRTH